MQHPAPPPVTAAAPPPATTSQAELQTIRETKELYSPKGLLDSLKVTFLVFQPAFESSTAGARLSPGRPLTKLAVMP